MQSFVLSSTFVIQSNNADAIHLFGPDVVGRPVSNLIQGPFKQRISSILYKRSIQHRQFCLPVPVLSEKSELLLQKWVIYAQPSGLWDLTCKTIRVHPADAMGKTLAWIFDEILGFQHVNVDKVWQDNFKIPQYLALAEWLNFVHPLDKKRVLDEFGLFLLDSNRHLNCRYRMASNIGIELMVQSTGRHSNKEIIATANKRHISGFHQVLSANLDDSKKIGHYGTLIEDCEKEGIALTWQGIDWKSIRLSSEVLRKTISTLIKPFQNTVYSIRINLSDETKADETKANHCISCNAVLEGEYVILRIEVEDLYFHPRHLRQILQYGYLSQQIQNSKAYRLESMVHEMQGHFNITSLEKRMIYSFYFSNNRSSTKTPPLRSESTNRKPHILVVDDHEVVLRYLKDILTVAGYHVTTISNSRTALDLFESKPDNVDLVITDLSMPDMRGSELVSRILKCRGNMSVIVCSGDDRLLAEEEAKKAGATGYFSKPIDIPSLLDICRSQFDRKFAFPSKDLA